MSSDIKGVQAASNAEKESTALRFLYGTSFGRVLLRLLTGRGLSKLCGRFLDSALSKRLIPSFVRKNNICLDDYADRDFQSFNQFFTRRIRAELRPIEKEPSALIAPCDGLLSAYPIRDGLVIPVKQSRYTISSLLGGLPAAKNYDGGLCLVFRLCVDNYHRYCYVDGGIAGSEVFIPGKLHTVRPIALERFPVFTENCRACTPVKTDNFGTAMQIEVGAMLVGRISNHKDAGLRVERGQEKGMFLYGGSTVIVLLEAGRAELNEEITSATESGREFPVLMGMSIGRACAGSPRP